MATQITVQPFHKWNIISEKNANVFCRITSSQFRTFSIFTLILLCFLGSFSNAAAADIEGNATLNGDDISVVPGTILIPFTKTWTGDSTAVRPDSITVKLYKYLGDTFNVSTAILVETKILTAEINWSYEFDISDEALYSGTTYSSATAYKWAVVEDEVAGYTETAHTDPSVIFNPPEVAGDGWVRTTPNNKLSITTSGNEKSIICVKKGNVYIVWSVDPLSIAERLIVFNSAADGIQGIGNPQYNKFTFISGFGTSSSFGLTVTEDQILFTAPSDWSFYATGIYNKSTTQTNASGITNTKKGTITVDKVTLPEGDSQSFTFTATGEGYSGFSLADQGTPNTQTLPPGTYSVSETTPDGWTLTSTVCTSSVAEKTQSANNIVLEAGEAVTCTFTNT